MALVNFFLSFITNLKFILAIVLIFLWLIIRSVSDQSNRKAVALSLLVLANFMNPIVNGITFLSFTTPIGQFNAVLTWLLILLATYETFMIKYKNEFTRFQNFALFALGFSWFIAMLSLIAQSVPIRAQIFYLPICLIILKIASPSPQDSIILQRIASLLIIFLFICAILRYQSSSQLSSDLPYLSNISAYSNQVWNIFGQSQRFRGPYSHPNQAGQTIGLLTLLLLFSSLKFKKFLLIICAILLALTSSRTAILATSTSTIIYLLLSRKKPTSRISFGSIIRYFSMALVLLSYFIILLVEQNRTLTGRTHIWSAGLMVWKMHPWLGSGFETIGVENSYISLMMTMGLFGIILLIFILFSLWKCIQKCQPKYQSIIYSLIIYIFVESIGENLFQPFAFANAVLAFLFIVIYSRQETPAPISFQV